MQIPDYSDVLAAHERIRPWIHQTPVLTSRYFNERTGAELFFKCENFQKAGAFKARGHSVSRRYAAYGTAGQKRCGDGIWRANH